LENDQTKCKEIVTDFTFFCFGLCNNENKASDLSDYCLSAKIESNQEKEGIFNAGDSLRTDKNAKNQTSAG
jgi:hypothetical protein